MLGLGYPGGPLLDRLAQRGEAARQRLPVPSLPGLEFSFSGLKTALLYRIRDLGGDAALEDSTRADLAAAFQESVVTALLEKLELALDERAAEQVVVCGGVAANSELRTRAGALLAGRGRLIIPSLKLCTDNAAMIAAAARFQAPLAYPEYLALDASARP
jgi:N6-L-threonylcarbamoyladenine synthase